MPPAQTSRSDCSASAVSASRLTDRRRQRGPSAGAAAHAAPVKQDPCYSIGASVLLNRQFLGDRTVTRRRCGVDSPGFPTYLFLYSLLYFGDVIYCKYPSSKYRREYRFPLCEACLYIVKKKTRAAFPLFTPSHRPKLDPREIAPSRRLSGPSCMSVPEASPAHRSPLG